MASITSTKRGPTYALSPALSATTTNSVSPALSAFDPVTSGLSSANTTVPSSPGKEKTNPFALTGPAIGLDSRYDLKELERRVRDGQGRKVETWGHRGASAAFREFSHGLPGQELTQCSREYARIVRQGMRRRGRWNRDGHSHDS